MNTSILWQNNKKFKFHLQLAMPKLKQKPDTGRNGIYNFFPLLSQSSNGKFLCRLCHLRQAIDPFLRETRTI